MTLLFIGAPLTVEFGERVRAVIPLVYDAPICIYFYIYDDEPNLDEWTSVLTGYDSDDCEISQYEFSVKLRRCKYGVVIEDILVDNVVVSHEFAWMDVPINHRKKLGQHDSD